MVGNESMGETAENINDIYQISRFQPGYIRPGKSPTCHHSHGQRKIFRRNRAGIYSPKEGSPILFSTDERPRRDNLDGSIGRLKPAFRKDERYSG